MTKEKLRATLIAECQKIDEKRRKKFANGLYKNILPLIKGSSNIAIYRAYGWEISLQKVITHCVEFKKKLFQPVASKEHRFMYFTLYDEANTKIFIQNSDFKKLDSCINLCDLDLILIPLVGVDAEGYRLGKGGGYYDATLSALDRNIRQKPILCGVGYSCQIVDKIPHDEWDIKLDYFVSEVGLIEF